MGDNDDALQELCRKVEGSLTTTIRRHVEEHAPQHGITAWNAKNSVMLSYLIELTYQRRCGTNIPIASQHRLLELRTILEKMRSLDKKLRYQIDKLLTLNEENFAKSVADDPLLYRPSVQDDDDSSDDNEEEVGEETNEDDDDDLATARQTVALAKTHQAPHATSRERESEVYRAPRHAAVPYNLDRQDRERTRDLQRRRKMRDSEVAEAIRHEYSETPETEDVTGGTAMGRQRAGSRKLIEQERERERFEEDNMMRLSVTKEVKKNRKRMMRDEMSNLSAIADLGNIAKESKFDRKRKKASSLPLEEEEAPRKREYEARPRNALQADIFGGEQTKKKKKKGKR